MHRRHKKRAPLSFESGAPELTIFTLRMIQRFRYVFTTSLSQALLSSLYSARSIDHTSKLPRIGGNS